MHPDQTLKGLRMPKIIIGNVNVLHPETLELVTLVPGDAFPEWAEGIITNPAVVSDISDPEPEPDPEPEKPKRGRQGKKDDVPPPPVDLKAKAKELGIEFTDETTDQELQLLIDAKE